MATLAITNIRKSSNTKIDSRNDAARTCALTSNADWLDHFVLQDQSATMQANCTKKSLPNVVIPDNAIGTQRKSNFAELQSQWPFLAWPGRYTANGRNQKRDFANGRSTPNAAGDAGSNPFFTRG